MNTNLISPTDSERWQAVIERDPAMDGAFVFAVRSTAIYCRPSCPSRRPRREQVTFFVTPSAARAAGYRPCKRCLPDRPLAPTAELVESACRAIESAIEPPSLAELGKLVGASPAHLQRVFKSATGLSPRQYAAGLRAGRLKAELRDGRTVTNALYAAGYNSSSRLYEEAPARLGMTPSVYRTGGKDMHILYTISDCSLGRLLVAVTARGVCAVSLGENDAALVDALRDEYPAARLEPAAGPGAETAAVLAYLTGAERRLDLPLDVQATAFQLRVWEELRRIPYGETRTYSQVATALGQTQAARAVANACASNPAALITPCHRVIRSDGRLGGYRWGLERKRALLRAEQG